MSACEQEVLGTLRREHCQMQYHWEVRKRNTTSNGGGTCPLGTSTCGILVRQGCMCQGSQIMPKSGNGPGAEESGTCRRQACGPSPPGHSDSMSIWWTNTGRKESEVGGFGCVIVDLK